jgi:hypothetical protein
MERRFDRTLFERIFSDANVADVDFSQWDKSVGIYVFADHVYVPTPARLPLFVADFVRVRKFCVTFNHLEIALEEPDQHFQWNIDEFKIEEVKGLLCIRLYGGRTWPDLELHCESVEIERVDSKLLDTLFPGWNRPGRALARPSIEGLAELARTRLSNGDKR